MELQQLLGILGILGLLVLAVTAILMSDFIFRKKPYKAGSITSPSGIRYPYTVEDNIFGSGEPFHGMVIALPKSLPHIYLDSHHDSRTIGPQHTFDSSQKISLEGDFNTYFQLFAPQRYHILTLSLVTPDVMHTLIDHGKQYDIEIHSRQVFVISRQKIKSNPQQIEQLRGIGEQLIRAIDHRLQSWTIENEQEASRANLQFKKEASVKLFVLLNSSATISRTIIPSHAGWV